MNIVMEEEKELDNKNYEEYVLSKLKEAEDDLNNNGKTYTFDEVMDEVDVLLRSDDYIEKD